MVIILVTVALSITTVVAAVLLLFDIVRWAGWVPEMGILQDGGNLARTQTDHPGTTHGTQGSKWTLSRYLQSRFQCVVLTPLTETGQMQGLTSF